MRENWIKWGKAPQVGNVVQRCHVIQKWMEVEVVNAAATRMPLETTYYKKKKGEQSGSERNTQL